MKIPVSAATTFSVAAGQAQLRRESRNDNDNVVRSATFLGASAMVQGPKRFQQIGLLVVLLVASALVAASVAAQGTAGNAVMANEISSPSTPMVIKGAEHVATVTPRVTERALRDLPKAKAWQQGDPIREIPRRVYPRSPKEGTPPRLIAPRRDPLLDREESAPEVEADRVFTSPGLNFPGISFTGAAPPDPVGEVGPNHYVQMVNGALGAVIAIDGTYSGVVKIFN